MSFSLSSGQWSLLTRPPVSGRPYKTRKPLPLYPYALLTFYVCYALGYLLYTTLRSLGPFRFFFRRGRNHFAVVVVTNCLRSSAMSCELNQSAECPDAPDAGKRYTGPVCGQRQFGQENRANPRLPSCEAESPFAGYLQRYDSPCRIPSVLSAQHDKTMTRRPSRNAFAFAA